MARIWKFRLLTEQIRCVSSLHYNASLGVIWFPCCVAVVESLIKSCNTLKLWCCYEQVTFSLTFSVWKSARPCFWIILSSLSSESCNTLKLWSCSYFNFFSLEIFQALSLNQNVVSVFWILWVAQTKTSSTLCIFSCTLIFFVSLYESRRNMGD